MEIEAQQEGASNQPAEAEGEKVELPDNHLIK
jgi:hypothetical protein